MPLCKGYLYGDEYRLNEHSLLHLRNLAKAGLIRKTGNQPRCLVLVEDYPVNMIADMAKAFVAKGRRPPEGLSTSSQKLLDVVVELVKYGGKLPHEFCNARCFFMKLSDMKTGMVVITRNHEVFVVLRDLYHCGAIQNLFWNPHDWLSFDRFNDDLTCIPDYDDLFDLLPTDEEPTLTEKRNARKRAQNYANSHNITEVMVPQSRQQLFSKNPEGIVIWQRDSNESSTDLIPADNESDIRSRSRFVFPETLHHEKATLSDLKTGLIVTLRNGDQYIVMRDFYDVTGNSEDLLWSKNGCIPLSRYTPEMNYIDGGGDSPYDIVEVYLSEGLSDFYRKREYGGNILWRNEPLSTTYRRWIMDVPPCTYTGKAYQLSPEATRPTWVPEDIYASFLKNG